MRIHAILAAATLALAGCGAPMETLRPAQDGQAAVIAAIEKPAGAGPFPAVILLHPCGGPGAASLPAWVTLLTGAGFLVATPDQHTPHGVTTTCLGGGERINAVERPRDTRNLVAALRARPDVRADRIFLLGFSAGADVTLRVAAAPTAPVADPMPIRGAVAVYPGCRAMPAALRTEVLIISGLADDLTPARICEAAVANFRGEPRPRFVALPDAHHGFDNMSFLRPTFLPTMRNVNQPSGYGATMGYNAAATEQARRDVLAFLRERL